MSAFHPGGATAWSWWWKTLFTAATVGAGFKGGEVTPLFFVGATVIALAIACLTVFSQAWRVARAEPARALRYE